MTEENRPSSAFPENRLLKALGIRLGIVAAAGGGLALVIGRIFSSGCDEVKEQDNKAVAAARAAEAEADPAADYDADEALLYRNGFNTLGLVSERPLFISLKEDSSGCIRTFIYPSVNCYSVREMFDNASGIACVRHVRDGEGPVFDGVKFKDEEDAPPPPPALAPSLTPTW